MGFSEPWYKPGWALCTQWVSWQHWVNPGKRGGMDGVFRGLFFSDIHSNSNRFSQIIKIGKKCKEKQFFCQAKLRLELTPWSPVPTSNFLLKSCFLKKKNWINFGNYFWENKAHIFITKYVTIEIFKNSDGSMFLGKSS